MKDLEFLKCRFCVIDGVIALSSNGLNADLLKAIAFHFSLRPVCLLKFEKIF